MRPRGTEAATAVLPADGLSSSHPLFSKPEGMPYAMGSDSFAKIMDRISDMMPRIFHIATAGYYMFVVVYWMQMNIPSKMSMNMPDLKYNWWQYLTVWNMIIQGCNFVVIFACDVMQSIPSRKSLADVKEKLEWLRDTVFQALTLPLAMCVFGIFWVTFAYDRELIYPPGMDVIVPFWFNHLLHTAILFFPWVEMVLCPRPFDHLKGRYLFGMGIMVSYNVALIGAACWQGFWTYPFLGLLTPVQKTLFFIFMHITFTTAYIVSCKANEKICGVGVSDGFSHLHVDKKLT